MGATSGLPAVAALRTATESASWALVVSWSFTRIRPHIGRRYYWSSTPSKLSLFRSSLYRHSPNPAHLCLPLRRRRRLIHCRIRPCRGGRRSLVQEAAFMRTSCSLYSPIALNPSLLHRTGPSAFRHGTEETSGDWSEDRESGTTPTDATRPERSCTRVPEDSPAHRRTPPDVRATRRPRSPVPGSV